MNKISGFQKRWWRERGTWGWLRLFDKAKFEKHANSSREEMLSLPALCWIAQEATIFHVCESVVTTHSSRVCRVSAIAQLRDKQTSGSPTFWLYKQRSSVWNVLQRGFSAFPREAGDKIYYPHNEPRSLPPTWDVPQVLSRSTINTSDRGWGMLIIGWGWTVRAALARSGMILQERNARRRVGQL